MKYAPFQKSTESMKSALKGGVASFEPVKRDTYEAPKASTTSVRASQPAAPTWTPPTTSRAAAPASRYRDCHTLICRNNLTFFLFVVRAKAAMLLGKRVLMRCAHPSVEVDLLAVAATYRRESYFKETPRKVVIPSSSYNNE